MKSNHCETNRAFTLIELLIVVAIIAILAAIAVPNFLEAQVRSKVSRTKADMRSTATAIESYVVDNNKYPPDYSDYALNPSAMPHNSGVPYIKLLPRLLHLTTPIGYMTNLPTDFFAEGIAAGASGTVNASAYRRGATTEIMRPIVYDYAKFDRSLPSGNDSIGVWSEITTNPSAVQWALNSPGPDILNHTFLGFSGLVIYDPTNGTVSQGQILRTNVSAEDQPAM